MKVVPADADRFGAGHGYNTAPSAQTPAAIQRHRARGPAGRRGAAPCAHLGRRRVRIEHRSGRQDDRGHRALRSRHRTAAGRAHAQLAPEALIELPGSPTRTSSASERSDGRVRLHPEVGVPDAPPVSRPSAIPSSNATGALRPLSVSSPTTLRPSGRRSSSSGTRSRIPSARLVTVSWRCWPVVVVEAPAGALEHHGESAVSVSAGCGVGGGNRRLGSCSGQLAAAPLRPVRIVKVPVQSALGANPNRLGGVTMVELDHPLLAHQEEEGRR